ncbi:MAG: MoxR family ATPase [Thermofilaceae archaeon]
MARILNNKKSARAFSPTPSSSPRLVPAEELKKELERRGLFYPDNIISLLSAALPTSSAFLIEGPPGVGKTALVEALADVLKAKKVIYQCTPDTSTDDLLFRLLPSENTRSGVETVLGPLPEALLASREGLVVLLLDEFDKTRPNADAFLLDFIQNARLSVRLGGREKIIEGKKENLLVFLTSNKEREFSEPLLRRVVLVELPYLSKEHVFKVLSARFPADITNTLLRLYEATIAASLRKPATIVELIELGSAMQQLGLNYVTPELLRAFIAKYDDDYNKLISSIFFSTPSSAPSSVSSFVFTQGGGGGGGGGGGQPYTVLQMTHPDFEDVKERAMPAVLRVHEGCVLPADERHYSAALRLLLPDPTSTPEKMEGVEVHENYILTRTLTYRDICHFFFVAENRLFLFDFLSDSEVLFRLKADIDVKVLLQRMPVFMNIVYYTSDLVRWKGQKQLDTGVMRYYDVAVIGKTVEVVAVNGDPYDFFDIVDALLHSQRGMPIVKEVFRALRNAQKKEQVVELLERLPRFLPPLESRGEELEVELHFDDEELVQLGKQKAYAFKKYYDLKIVGCLNGLDNVEQMKEWLGILEKTVGW